MQDLTQQERDALHHALQELISAVDAKSAYISKSLSGDSLEWPDADATQSLLMNRERRAFDAARELLKRLGEPSQG